MNATTAAARAMPASTQADLGAVKDAPARRLVFRRLCRRRPPRYRSSARRCARPSICAPDKGCSTLPPATATSRWRRRARWCEGRLDRLCARAARSWPAARRQRRGARDRIFARADAGGAALSPTRASTRWFPPSASCSRRTRTKAAAELVRVWQAGAARSGLPNWTPEGFIGEVFKTIGKHLPPPTGVKSPALWGNGARASPRCSDRRPPRSNSSSASSCFRYRSAQQLARRLQDLLRSAVEDVRCARSQGATGADRRSVRADQAIQSFGRMQPWSCPANISKWS